MVKVNGNSFQIYLMDDEETIRDRIASTMNSLPKYLFFKNKIQLLPENYNIEVVDILGILKANSGETEFDVVYGKIKDYMEPTLSLEKDVFEVWLAFNERIPKDIKGDRGAFFDSLYAGNASKVLGRSIGSLNTFIKKFCIQC